MTCNCGNTGGEAFADILLISCLMTSPSRGTVSRLRRVGRCKITVLFPVYIDCTIKAESNSLALVIIKAQVGLGMVKV